mmetsp:Transcript_5807/g.14846  ORF Transcript_5807/g.14846 Transcript_5807/m.14846 type:complete len:460 (-) Transcript_5807:260-1639(-)
MAQTAQQPLLDAEAASEEEEAVHVTLSDIVKNFFLMGWVAFGGPTAHIGFFQKTFVEKLKWFNHAIFLEVLALCQCMPGPTSTQVSFAMGTFKQGTLGGLISGFLFNYPGAIVLTLLGVGLGDFIVNAPAGGLAKCVIAGLSAVGVALVACACVGLCRGACKDNVTVVLCTLAAAATTFSSSVYVLPVMLVIGGLTTLIYKWNEEIPPKEDVGDVKYGLNAVGGALLFLVYFALLGLSFLVDHQSWVSYADNHYLFWFAAFYRVGALIFGGGQVMIPLLINVVIKYDQICTKLPDGSTHCKMEESKDSWVTTDQFYAGLAAAQSMPGPLFNFSCYLGSVMGNNAHVNPYLASFVCWLGMFGPGVMLIFALLPFWGKFRNYPLYKKMMPGLNSSAVGLVVAAMFKMLLQVHGVSPIPSASLAIGIASYTAVATFKMEAPLAVIAGGALGAATFYANKLLA